MDAIAQIEAAETQMRKSLDLFQSGEYIPAITLAGAAEEIFGAMLMARGLQSAHEQDKTALHKLRAYRRAPAPESKELQKLFNGARNSLKHIEKAETVLFDSRQEAINLLHRCISNYVLLTGSSEVQLLRFLEEHQRAWSWE